ncbi:MAG: polyamine aminopropyltransferase [Thiohalomonadaceae bacterium]
MILNAQHWFIETPTSDGSTLALKVTGKIHEEQTEFQKIEVYSTECFGNLMVIDGYIMLTARDNYVYHEMMSHPAMFTHPKPKRVLIIGGGDCGTLREILRHPDVEQVQLVDIDAGVTRASEKFFPELCEANKDPRAELNFTDGIKWVKEAEPGSYDIIIVDSTDPIGPAIGLYVEEFYRDCLRALADDGIIVQQSESPLLHMQILTDMHKAMRAANFADVQTLQFPQPTYPSGWWTCTMAGKQALPNFRYQDSEQKSFPTRYYSAEIHQAAKVLPPFLKEAFAAIANK